MMRDGWMVRTGTYHQSTSSRTRVAHMHISYVAAAHMRACVRAASLLKAKERTGILECALH